MMWQTGYQTVQHCTQPGCPDCVRMNSLPFVSGISTVGSPFNQNQMPAPCEGCPALIDALKSLTRDLVDAESDVAHVRDVLSCVLDYVRGWDDMPQALVDDIDAIFDGNKDDVA